MLDLGRRRYKEQPIFGDQPQPEFSVFDGHRMDLGDDSVDRILCFDALHHVPNMSEVLAEMGRVLRPGGVAGFSEPGPHHSKDPQSQHEMRRYGVPEQDLVLEDVWAWARDAGFSDLSVGIFSQAPQWVSFETFTSFMATSATDAQAGRGTFASRAGNKAMHVLRPRGSSSVDPLLLALRRACKLAVDVNSRASAKAVMGEVAFLRSQLYNRRMFLIKMEGTEVQDSREATGLRAEIVLERSQLEPGRTVVRLSAKCTVTNTGTNRWLPSNYGKGAVLLGLRLKHGRHPSEDLGRVALPGDRIVEPGESVELELAVDVPRPRVRDDALVLEIDMVSEGISWFAEVDGHPIEVAIPPADQS
jgi:SAM-dependent methyltransferase